jgi:cardiolipin synthase
MTTVRTWPLATIPNAFTALRVLLAYPAWCAVAESSALALALIVFAAGCTDALDGWWARRYHQHTFIGRAIDPIADKIFVDVVLCALWMHGYFAPVLGSVLVSITVAYDIRMVVVRLRDYFSSASQAAATEAMEPSRAAKNKTAVQFAMLCIVGLSMRLEYQWLFMLGQSMAVLALGFVCYSWYRYEKVTPKTIGK